MVLSQLNKTVGSMAVLQCGLQQDLHQIQQLFESKNKELVDLFAQLANHMKYLEMVGVPDELKSQRVLQGEYLLVRLRTQLLAEYSSIQQALSSKPGVAIEKLFSGRLSVVKDYLAQLNQFRADMEAVQRTRYIDTFRR